MVSNLIWRFAERCGAQLVSFVVSVVIARILEVEAYGTVALVYVVISILQVFVDSGLGTALIQKKDADEDDFTTVFYANILFCTLLYILLFFSAPYIALFYDDLALTPLIRVLGICLIISGVKNIQQAYVSRNLIFKKFFFATLAGTIGAGVIGIYMAYSGYGVWALVAQHIFNGVVDTLILWITVKWRPTGKFSFAKFKSLFSYGWKLLASALLDTVYNKLRQLLIGKLYTSTDLAYYNKGDQMPAMVVNNINNAIDSVLLPVMSEEQDDKTRLKAMMQRAMRTSMFFMAPMMLGLVAVAPVLIELLLTEKWLPTVFYLRVFCITYMFWPLHTANLNAIKALGRSDIFLKLEIIKKILGILVLLSTVWFGVKVMTYGMLLDSFASQLINSYPNKKLLNYGYREQIKDILPSILIALFMAICVYPIQWINLPKICILTIEVLVGTVIYALLAKVFKVREFETMMSLIRNRTSKKKPCD